MKRKNTNAATLIELLMVVGLMALLVVGTVMLLNPKALYGRAVDTQKKSDLSKFKKALEEYYNDKGCYPPPDQVCYLGGDNGTPVGNPCYVCGTEAGSPRFSPYLEELICDPNHPSMKFLYVVDNITCPTNYQIYAKFNSKDDGDSVRVGCAQSKCGPAAPWGYDYGESSPNSELKSINN